MPKINVYLPDALAAAVKEAGVPVSAVCQAALSDAVAAAARTRQAIAALRDPATPATTFQQLFDGISRKMTPRLVAALRVASIDAGSNAPRTISSLSMLAGVFFDSENLAVRLLVAQGIDVDALAAECASTRDEEFGFASSESDDAIPARMTPAVRMAFAAALEAVVQLGHNYVGCEHVLVGLALSESQTKNLLDAHGVDAVALRHAIGAATAGIVPERAGSVGSSASAIADLTRRLELLERRLSATEAS